MIRRIYLLSALAGFALAANALPASASVTIGQTQADSQTCSGNYDWVQPTVTSGNSYVVPAEIATGAITSWSSFANSNPGGVMTMKVYRPVTGSTYQVIGHDGPHTLTPSSLNTFSGFNIPVHAGDVLGVHAGDGDPGCVFGIGGDAGWYDPLQQDLADGQQAAFAPDIDDRLNLTAVVVPSNTFSLGPLTRNKKKGTATIAINDLPNPGDLTGSGSGVNAASAGEAVTSKSVGAGQAQLLIKAKGKKQKKLNETGKVKLNVAITYAPIDGSPNTQSVKVKLKKKLKK